MEAYLTQDITGLASKIEYGKKGDKVQVIRIADKMVLVERNGERFWINEKYLSE